MRKLIKFKNNDCSEFSETPSSFYSVLFQYYWVQVKLFNILWNFTRFPRLFIKANFSDKYDLKFIISYARVYSRREPLSHYCISVAVPRCALNQCVNRCIFSHYEVIWNNNKLSYKNKQKYRNKLSNIRGIIVHVFQWISVSNFSLIGQHTIYRHLFQRTLITISDD